MAQMLGGEVVLQWEATSVRDQAVTHETMTEALNIVLRLIVPNYLHVDSRPDLKVEVKVKRASVAVIDCPMDAGGDDAVRKNI